MSNFYNTENIAKKGRFEDTTVRTVKGEEAHVNPFEAYLIDTYDKAGEQLVSELGSGYINPNTGMREYSWLSALLDTGRHSYAHRGAKHQLSKTLGAMGGEVKEYLKPGGTLSTIFKGKLDSLTGDVQDQIGTIQEGAENLYKKSGLETVADNTTDMFENIYGKFKTNFGQMRSEREEAKTGFLEKMAARKRELLRDFQSATGYAFGGGGGGDYLTGMINTGGNYNPTSGTSSYGMENQQGSEY